MAAEMDSIRFNNLVMGFVFDLNKSVIEPLNFGNLKAESLQTIDNYKPKSGISYNTCQNMIHYLINIWIPQDKLSDDEYNDVSQDIYTLVHDSLKNNH